MAFLSFPYFWCIRVSPIQRLSLKFEYFLRPSEISRNFQMDEENIRILARVSGLEKHEYTKNMENLEMP